MIVLALALLSVFVLLVVVVELIHRLRLSGRLGTDPFVVELLDRSDRVIARGEVFDLYSKREGEALQSADDVLDLFDGLIVRERTDPEAAVGIFRPDLLRDRSAILVRFVDAVAVRSGHHRRVIWDRGEALVATLRIGRKL